MNKRPLALLLLTLLTAGPAVADEYGRHPFYLHALSDLRTAQWQVDHRRPEDREVSSDETIVRDELGAAIRDFERAAWQDGKGGDWRPPLDARLQGEGRLHAAIDLMRKAEADVAREEDDPRSRRCRRQVTRSATCASGTTAANDALASRIDMTFVTLDD